MAGQPVPPLLRFIRAIGPAAPDPDATDGQLLARFLRQRDDAAFTALFRRHGPMVWSVCRRVLADAHAAEDAFQATFLVFLRKAGSIGRPELLANYLYGIACRTAAKAKTLEAWRRVREEQRNADPPVIDDNGDSDWRDLRPLLDEELGRLPEKYRAPLVLCYLEGKTYAEAARALGWAEGTVSGRLARARQLLRGRLVRRGLTLSAGSLALLLPRAAPAAIIPSAVEEATLKAVTGAVPPCAAALSKGVLHAMFLCKLKVAGIVLSTVALIGSGAGVVTHRVLAAGRPGPQDPLALALPVAEQTAVAPAPPAKEKPAAEKDQPPSATSPDQRIQAIANDKAISLIDIATQKELRRFQSHTDKVTALAFSPDGKSLVSGGLDHTVQLWDLATGRLLWKFRGENAIKSVAFSKDGRSVAVQEGANTKRALDAATGKQAQ